MSESTPRYCIGTAAWTIPKESAADFPGDDTHLERYARELNAVEINSSFYRDHKPETYARWREAVPADFRFAVKLSRYFTHEKRLKETDRLSEILLAIAELQAKLGVLLVQLPPSLEFSAAVERFWSNLRRRFLGHVALEPRHQSWNSPDATTMLQNYNIQRVWADPDPIPPPTRREESDFDYFRLHGNPVIYQSDYDESALKTWRELLKAAYQKGREAWCIFDNTMFGHATRNALEMRTQLLRYG